MRLDFKIINFIQNYNLAIDGNYEIRLLGSRTDDTKKGGDIDLLFLTEKK